MLLFKQIGHPSFTGLTVDSNHRIVVATQVGRINGQVGDLPDGIGFLHSEAFLDGILV